MMKSLQWKSVILGLFTITLSLSLSLLYMGCGSKLGGGNPLGEIGGGIEDGADFGEGDRKSVV